MTAEDLAYHDKWKAASGHPAGWRVVRGLCPVQELCGVSGARILFRSKTAADRRADQLNKSMGVQS